MKARNEKRYGHAKTTDVEARVESGYAAHYRVQGHRIYCTFTITAAT